MSVEFKQSTPVIFCVIFFIITALVGGVFLWIEPWVSAAIWLLGVGIPAAVLYFHTSYVIRCTEEGFTVDQKSRRKGEKHDRYGWQDITETRYYEIETSSQDGHSSTTPYFEAHTAQGNAFKIGRIRRFHDLIKLFNEKACHLPYTWERRKGGFSLTTKADYVKEPRQATSSVTSAPPPLPKA